MTFCAAIRRSAHTSCFRAFKGFSSGDGGNRDIFVTWSSIRGATYGFTEGLFPPSSSTVDAFSQILARSWRPRKPAGFESKGCAYGVERRRRHRLRFKIRPVQSCTKKYASIILEAFGFLSYCHIYRSTIPFDP